jgi:hypothetical protein
MFHLLVKKKRLVKGKMVAICIALMAEHLHLKYESFVNTARKYEK